MKTTPSRRSFLKLAAACTAPAFGSLAFAAPQTQQKFDKVADVIVIGSGFAGLAAALEAKEKGASVMLLEKMPAYGGNSAINGGAFAVAGSPLQEKEGIKDSPELMLQDMIKSGRGLSHVDLLKNIVYGTRPAFDFTVKYGVKYKPFVQHFGGHSVPRIMQTVESTGGGITRPLVEAAKNLGVDMHLGCAVTDLILNNEGRVIGVKVLERHDYRKENSGVPQVYGARKGVVAATGGFSQNVAFRMQQDPTLGPNLESTNHPGATGDVLIDLVDIGAGTRGLDYIQCIPGGVPGEKHAPNLFTHVDRFLFVNLDGKRFIKEDARRDVLRDAMLDQPKAIAWTIVDADGFEQLKNSKGPENEVALKTGTLYYADSIEDLAKKIGVPANNLKEAVDTYNKAVDTKKDPLGRAEGVLVNKIIKAPFYAGRVTMKRHHTMGGVIINKDAQVIDRRGNVVPGLYAAGEVTGGIHGTNRVGGNAMADIFTYGRIAGVNAAKNPA